MALLLPLLFDLLVLIIAAFLYRALRKTRWGGRFVAIVALALVALSLVPLWRNVSVLTSEPNTHETSIAESAPSQPPAQLKTAEDFLAQGTYEFDNKNYDAAIANYTRAIELKPDSAEAYNNRAYTYMAEQQYALALPDLDRALQLRPDYVNALMNRGDIYNYYYSIDYDRALADYNRVEELGGAHSTSVCGHRLLAENHGWSPLVFVELMVGHNGCKGNPGI